MELERQRGISVTSSVLQFDYEGFRINLLDTPGHEDFSEDTYRTLMAADSAVMLLDNRRGVEDRTRQLFAVCKRRRMPIFTFVNKCDRAGEDPLKLISDVEADLEINCYPVTWPIYRDGAFAGVYDRRRKRVEMFERGLDHGAKMTLAQSSELHDPSLIALLGEDAHHRLVQEIGLLDAAGHAFDHAALLTGDLSPVFFGSALTNFGVEPFLEEFLDLAPAPSPHESTKGVVEPTDPEFSGFVFKIQANMDPRHRDRIAFFRVCSGRYQPAMKVRHVRASREMKLANALTFMANERVASEDAVAGDIIGIHNHGQLQIGDTLTEGEPLAFRGIPYFAPELFRIARPRDPFRAKPLSKGLQELGEEGAIQVFASAHTNTLLLGAVGPLQFEIVAQRLATEYNVDAIYETANIATARWLTFPDDAVRRNFEREQAAALATDVDGNPVFLATNKYNLQVTMERWPKVGFHATREHGERLAHA